MSDKGQIREIQSLKKTSHEPGSDGFVLDKDIFSNIFDKDIRRVYFYKKAERLAKALHLIAPAFASSPALRERLDQVALAVVEAATLVPARARPILSRELLTLSSMLGMAEAGGLLSAMNAALIAREAHLLLQEIASYEEPRLSFPEVPTLAALAKSSTEARGPRSLAPELHASPEEAPRSPVRSSAAPPGRPAPPAHTKGQSKRHLSDSPAAQGRRDAILEVLRTKGSSYIRDISGVIRDVSEKTIQRELQALVTSGVVRKEGERRWTTYVLVS